MYSSHPLSSSMVEQKKQIQRTRTLAMLLGLVLAGATVSNINRVGQRFFRQLAIPPSTTAPHQKLLGALQALANLPASEKKETLLFIPIHNDLYWRWTKHCPSAPFMAPAITGMALLDGLPSSDCILKDYGYSLYQQRSPEDRDRLAEDAAYRCSEARELGFYKLIILDADRNNNPIVRRQDCS